MATYNPNLHSQFLLDPSVIFLNHGSFGATPRPVFDAYQRWQRELENQPVEFLGRRAPDLLQNSRAILARYVRADCNDLAYIPNATMGINIVAHSLHLKQGDEVLGTDHEYGAIDKTWTFLSKKNGFKYINQPVHTPVSSPETVLDDLWAGVTRNTRVICISHITSPTALIFPVQEICRKARQAGIMTVIDGAHAPGQISLSLQDLGADFYTGNLHKWLCAPKGSAFLYARTEVQALIEPLPVSWGWQNENPGPSLFVDYIERTGTRDLSAYLAVPDAIEFLQHNDWDAVRLRCHSLASEASQRLKILTGLPALSPDSPQWFSQMISIPLPAKIDVKQLQIDLRQNYHIEIPVLCWNGMNLIRLSVQGYNTEKDIDALISALTFYLKSGES
jgi:isopenicillin-N epimerase